MATNTKESYEASAAWVVKNEPQALTSASAFQRAILRRRGLAHTRTNLLGTWHRCRDLYVTHVTDVTKVTGVL